MGGLQTRQNLVLSAVTMSEGSEAGRAINAGEMPFYTEVEHVKVYSYDEGEFNLLFEDEFTSLDEVSHGAKATIKIGKERAPLSWQITLMSKTAASCSKLTRLIQGLTKDLIRNLRENLNKSLKRNLKRNPLKSLMMNLRKTRRKKMIRSKKRKRTRKKIRKRTRKKIRKRTKKRTRRKKRRKTRMKKRSLKRRMTKSPMMRKMRSHLMNPMNNLTSMSYHHQRAKLSTVPLRKRPEQWSIWSVLSWKVSVRAWVKA